VLDLSAKLYPRILDLAVTSDPKIIFIILIITLNLHDPVGLAAIPDPIGNSLGCGSGCKVVS
jgi:hypothetical protein